MTISQELFDETILENEECFDLSPHDALRETIDQFCQQLGHSPRQKIQNTDENSDSQQVLQSIPVALAHLSLTHPTSTNGKLEREARQEFRDWLEMLDECVKEDGVVILPQTNGDNHDVVKVLTQLSERMQCNTNDDGHDALPYLILFQQSSSIYTLMSFLTAIYTPGNDKTTTTTTTEEEEVYGKLQLVKQVAQTLTAILTSSPSSRENVKCVMLRAELRDLFVGGMYRLVPLLFQFAIATSAVAATETNSHEECNDNNTITTTTSWNKREQFQSVLIELLKLSISAVKGCENGKVAFVQSTLAQQLLQDSTTAMGLCKTKRGGVQLIFTLLSNNNNNCITPSLSTTTQSSSTSSVDKSNAMIITEATCQLLATLCRYDDFRTDSNVANGSGGTGVSTSSAHDHAQEFHRVGVERLLVKIAVGVLDELEGMNDVGNDHQGECCSEQGDDTASLGKKEMLAASVLTALRVLAVNDEIIQTMVALGVLPIVTKSLRLGVGTNENDVNNENESQPNLLQHKHRLASASLGLLRNLCGNDEIKTNLCLGSTDQQSSFSTPSALPHILQAMKMYPTISPIQEHACGALAAMALRRPMNARAIIEEGGPRLILTAMKRHEENVGLQRQGALAVRNIVSRLMKDLDVSDGNAKGSGVSVDARSDIRDRFAELGVEDVLRNIAGRHQGSVDEAYAALRDLGYSVALTKFSAEDLKEGKSNFVGRTMMFGEKHNSNFRPVYEESAGLNNAVDTAVCNFGA